MGTLKNFSVTTFAAIFFLTFLSAPAFGQSFLWITGAANYLYGPFIILLFLVAYRLQIDRKCKGRKNIFFEIVWMIIAFLGGIIAGWTNENNAVALIITLILFICGCKYKKISLRGWNFSGLLGSAVGSYLMLMAPGTRLRLSHAV